MSKIFALNTPSIEEWHFATFTFRPISQQIVIIFKFVQKVLTTRLNSLTCQNKYVSIYVEKMWVENSKSWKIQKITVRWTWYLNQFTFAWNLVNWTIKYVQFGISYKKLDLVIAWFDEIQPKSFLQFFNAWNPSNSKRGISLHITVRFWFCKIL